MLHVSSQHRTAALNADLETVIAKAKSLVAKAEEECKRTEYEADIAKKRRLGSHQGGSTKFLTTDCRCTGSCRSGSKRKIAHGTQAS